MKRLAAPIVLAGLTLTPGPARTVRGAPSQAGLEARVTALEEALKTQVETTRELAERLERVVAYLDEEARQARELSRTLERAEALGFTAGINFESRQVLLQGWRKALAAQAKGLGSRAKDAAPKQPAPAPRSSSSQEQ